LRSGYLEKAGKKVTKAGAHEDLYALALRGEFAALAGMPDWKGGYSSELSPSEMRQLLSTGSSRKKSPLALLNQITQDGEDGADLVEKEFMPEIVKGIRTGIINLDASVEDAISTSFASLVARTMIALLDRNGSGPKLRTTSKPLRILMDALDRSTQLTENHAARGVLNPDHRHAASPYWANELRVFLKLYSVKYE
jgi:hypothetical protein